MLLSYFKESGKCYAEGWIVERENFEETVDYVRSLHKKGELPDIGKGSGKDFYVLIHGGTHPYGYPVLLLPIKD